MRKLTLAIFVVCLGACGGDDDSAMSPNVTRDEKLVGPAGAVLALSDGTKVEIPAGALLEPVTIVIRELDDAKPLPVNLEQAGKPYAFEPHGTLFARPVKVSLPYDEARDDMLDVRPVKLDDDQDETWRTVVGSDKRDGKLEFDVLSFSIYRAARPNRTSGWITLPDGAAFYPDSGNVPDSAMPDSGDAMIDAGALDADTIDANIIDANANDASDSGDAAVARTFDDANLEARVRMILNIPTAPLTQQDLDGLTNIHTGIATITSLVGLERCTNLQQLTIFTAQVDDLSPISALTSLTSLQLGSINMTGSLADLSGLSNLRVLNLNTSSAVGSLADLNGLTNLTELHVNHTAVTGDLADIAALNALEVIDVAFSAITGDVMILSDVTSLRALTAYDATVGGDLSAFVGRNLATLWLGDFNGDSNSGGTVTGDISSLSSATQITRLHLAGPGVNVTGDLSDLTDNDALQNLSLKGAGITGALSSISGLLNLRGIDLIGTAVTGNLQDISGMTSLLGVYLSDTSIGGSLSDLSGLTNLYGISLWDMPAITGDLSALAGLNLQQLSLSNDTNITGSLAALTGMQNLSYVQLDNTSITPDLAPLATSSATHVISTISVRNIVFNCGAQADEIATLRGAGTTLDIDCP